MKRGSSSAKVLAPKSGIPFWRSKIDRINLEMLDLLNARAKAACRIGRFKKELGLPISDPAREKSILETLSKRTRGPLDAAGVKAIFSVIIRETKRVERGSTK